MSKFCLRLLSVLLALSCLSACAPIIAMIGYGNSAVQIAVQLDRAKLLGDGMSYLGSGKTITDHAVSIVAHADCRVMNVISPNPVCAPRRDDTTIARNERVNIALLRDELRNDEARPTDFPPGATADDGATAHAQQLVEDGTPEQ
jgi:hypothetical protein